MHRHLVAAGLFCVTLAAAACGSDSTSPKPDTFAGTWNGAIISNSVTIGTTVTNTQTGNSYTGSGIVSAGGNSDAFTITGTSTPPLITGTILATVGPSTVDTLTLTATYISADSIAGNVVQNGGASGTISLKKQ